MGKTTAAPPDRAYIASNRSQWAFCEVFERAFRIENQPERIFNNLALRELRSREAGLF